MSRVDRHGVDADDGDARDSDARDMDANDSDANDGARRAVRVELDDASGAVAPAVVSAPNGSPIWTMGVVFVLMAAVVGALIALSPEANATADGERSDAAELPIENRATDDTTGVDEVNENLTDEVGTDIFGDFERPLELDGVLQHVFAQGNGLVGVLGNVGPLTSPAIVRSVDGLEWIDIPTSVDVFDGDLESPFDSSSFPLAPQLWSGVASVGSQNAVTTSAASTYLSADAETWTLLNSVAIASGTAVPIRPIVANDESILGLQHGPTREFASLFAEHTSVDSPPDGICEATPLGPASELVFQLTSCLGNDVGLLTPESVIGEVAADAVLDCVQLLMSSNITTTARIVRQSLRFDGEVEVLGNTSRTRIDPNANLVALRDGGFVGVDIGPNGVPPSAICSDVIDVETFTRPAFVVVHAQSDRVLRWPAPDGVTNTSEPPIIFGAVNLLSGQTLLVVDFGGELWTLDIATGDWVDLVISNSAAFDRVFDETIAISNSGQRIYRLSSNELTAFDVFDNEHGMLTATATTVPVDIGRYVSRLQVVHADDDIIIFNDGRSTWTIDTPS